MDITLKLAWRNLWRHPRRTWLTTGAMVFSNVLLVVMISLQFGMYELMISNSLKTFTGHLQVQAEGYKDDMRMRQVVPDAVALAESIRNEPGTGQVTVRGSAFALASSADRSYGIQVFGIQPEFEPTVSNLPGLVTQGRYLEKGDYDGMVIGAVLARNLQVGVGDELTLMGSGRDGSFAAGIVNITGIFETGMPDIDRSFGELPLEYFQDTFFMEGAAHQLVIDAGHLSLVAATVERVAALLPDDSGLVVHDWNALMPGLRQAIQADMGSAFFMYGILVVLVAFSVLNTQLMSVLERTREFGIVMALGLTPARLGRLIMLESSLMGLLGLAIGSVLGTLVTLWLSVQGFTLPGMEATAAQFNLPSRFYPDVGLMGSLAGPAVVLLFTLIAAIYPAVRLRWLHPVQAMRTA